MENEDYHFRSYRLRSFIVVALLFGMFAGVSELAAQVAEGTRIFTLEDCFAEAEKNNPDIQLADVQIEGADASVQAAFGQYLPNLSANAGYSRILNSESVFSPGGGIIIRAPVERPNNYALGVNAFYNVFDGFAREENYSSAKDNLRSVEFSASNSRRQVLADIANQFFTVLRDKETVRIRRENLETQQKEVERARALVAAGTAAITVQYSQEAEEGSRELLLAQAENALAISKTNLLVLMGLPPTNDFDISEGSLPTAFTAEDMRRFREQIGDLTTVVKKAFTERPDVRSADFAVASADARTDAAFSGYLPSVTFNAGWNWRNFELALFDAGNSFLGFNVNIPIFDRFQTHQQIQSAKVATMQAETQRIQIKQRVSAEIQQAVLQLQASEKEIEITDRALRAADLNYESLKARFDVGSSGILEVINANNQLVNAKINKINAHFGYLATRYQLQFALGKMPNK